MKVGDYIHFHKENYLKYGLSVDKPQSVDPVSVLNAQKAAIINSMPFRFDSSKQNIKQQLESELNYFFNLQSKDEKGKITGWISSDAEALGRMLEEICEEAANQLKPNVFDGVDIDYATLSATGTVDDMSLDKDVSKKLSTARKNAHFNDKQSKTTVQAVLDRIDLVLKVRNDIDISGITNATDADFVSKLDRMKSTYGGLREYVQSYVGKTGEFSGRDNKGMKTMYTKYGRVSNFITDLQELVDLTKQHIANEAQGILGEIMSTLSQIVFQESMGRNLQQLLALIGGNREYYVDLLKSRVVGNKKSVKVMSADKVIDKKNKSQSGTFGSIQAQIGDLEYNSTATQDKVDAILKLPDGQSINASMKNVNLYSGHGINILKGSNSINFLQDYPVFANHYMNIMANIGRSDPFIGSILQQAHEAMKLTIALKALVGGVLTADAQGNISRNAQAEILVVNNIINGCQGFKVYFMSDLISKIETDMSMVNIRGFESIVQYQNNWIVSNTEGIKTSRGAARRRAAYTPSMEHAWARVAKILAQLRLQNLEVSLSPRILSGL